MAVSHWLLRVDFAGQVYLWSDAPVTPVDGDGRSWPHLGGLPDPRVPSDYDPFQQQPRVQTASVEVVWPPDDPIGAIIEEGHRFPESSAELSLWEEGTTYESREVVIEGRPSEPEYGAADQPVAFSIESRPWDDAGSTHESGMRVTNETWTTGDDAGEPWYPIVIGRPGWGLLDIGSNSTYTFGSPALVVARSGTDATRLLIAGHSVQSPTVSIYDGTNTQSFTVEHVTDGLGRMVAIVDISGAGAISQTADSYSTIWDAGGSMTGPGGAISGAGDAILWAVTQMDYPVDYGRVYAWRLWLNRFTVAGYIDEPVDLWDLVQDAWLTNLLPVSVVVRGGKLIFIPWRYDVVKAEAMRHIEVGPGLTVSRRIVHERNRIHSRYRLSVATRSDGKSRVSAALGTDTPTDRRTTATRIAAVAETWVGDVLDSDESSWAGDIETAFMSMHWRSIRDFVTRYVEVQDITGEYNDLEDGDPVTITYTDAGITREALGLVAVDRVSTVAQTLRVIILPTV